MPRKSRTRLVGKRAQADQELRREALTKLRTELRLQRRLEAAAESQPHTRAAS